MVTWTHTFVPILHVLLAGGEIEFGKLADEAMSTDPSRFRDVRTVELAVDSCCHCLDYDDARGVVKYNRNAGKYSNSSFLLERSVQYALHEAVPNMEDWQLYPLVTKLNSEKCYLGISWNDIPEDIGGMEDAPFNTHCDFRNDGKDHCRLGCRVDESILKKCGLA
jgi:hypothetical protein